MRTPTVRVKVTGARGPGLGPNDLVTLQSYADSASDEAALSQAWAEGTEPGGPGTKSAKGSAGDAGSSAQSANTSAQIAEVNAATSDQARAAVEQAIADIPSDATLMLEAPDRGVLRGLTAMPVGRLAYLAEPYREGIWQWRLGNYSAQIAADTFEGRYLKAASVSASVGAWVRIIVGSEFQASR